MEFRSSFIIGACAVLMAHADVKFGEAPFSLTLESNSLQAQNGQEADTWSTRFRLSAPISIQEGQVVALTGTYEHIDYDWQGDGLFGELTESRIGLFTLHDFSNDWRLLTISNLVSRRANGADWAESLTYSGIYGAWYQGFDSLLIGGGLVVSTRLDEGIQFVPIILLDWEFADHWHLTTRPTPGTRFGPGLSVYYLPEERWSLYGGLRYVSSRYLLEDDSVYEYKTARAFSTVEYKLTERLALSVSAGVNLSGKVEVDDESVDLDPSLFLGMDLSWRF